MSPEQCRAARAWLQISQEDLAKSANVGASTVRDFEAGRRTPIANNLAAIQAVLEKQGIGFPFVLEGGAEIPCGITFDIKNKSS